MESLKVIDYLNAHPVVLRPQMPIEEASEMLTRSGQLGAPVLDINGALVGFLSESDILKKILETGYYREHCYEVENVMTKQVLTVKPYDSIVELAQTMLLQKPKLYPVIDDEGRVIGIISRSNVLTAIDRHIKSIYRQKA
ncbi:CBS domain-containing protein [Thalassotalea ponticola]|uniref:CBS domain-containing protein n=1 Tax=Thalassotalea ponticola TaxID=1523392 RepID=UPI0025B32D80|nr:CBS domain-containing protein [Thalassotalea ponticola]MDN3653108.1 CBS domain-containing protein [Thalassotalea ponticola]